MKTIDIGCHNSGFSKVTRTTPSPPYHYTVKFHLMPSVLINSTHIHSDSGGLHRRSVGELRTFGCTLPSKNPHFPPLGKKRQKMMFSELLIIFACVHLSYCIQSDVPAEDLIQTSPFTSSSDISVVNSESETVRIPSGGSSTLPTILDSSDLNQGDFVKTSVPNGRSVAKISWNPVNSAVSTEAFTKNTNDESTHLSKNVSNSLETDAAVYHTTQSIYDNLDHGENELDSDVSKNTLKTTQNPDVLSFYKFDANSTENSTDIPFSVSTNSVLSRSDEELMSRIYVSSLPLSEYYTEAPTGSLTTLIDEYTANTTILDSSIKSTSTSVTEVSNSALFTEGKDISSLLHESNVSSSKFFETTTDISEKNIFEDLVTEANNTKDVILVTESINHLNDLKPTISTSSELFDGKTFQQNSTIENFSTVTTLDSTANEQGFGLDIHTTFTEMSKVLEAKTTSFSEQPETSTLSSTSGLENTITDKSITEMFTAKHSDTLPPDTSPNITISISSTPILHIDSLSENFSEANAPKNNYETTTAEATFFHSNSTSHLNESTYTENKTFTSSAYDLSKDTETETVHDSIIHSSTASVFTESEISVEGTTISSSLPEVTEIKKTLPLSTVSFASDNMSLYTHTTSPTTDSLDVQEISIATDTEKDVSQFSTKSVTLSTENPTITHFPFSILMHFTGMSSSIDSDTITKMTQKATDISHEQNFSTTTASHLSSTIFGNPEDPNSSDIISTTVSSSTVKSTHSEQNIVSQTISHPSSTTTDLTITSTDHNEYPISTFSSTEETTVSNTEGSKITDPVVTLLSDKYSSSAIPVSTATWTVPPETHREGKHIPFSSISTIDPTSRSSFRVVTTDKIPTMETTRNETEIHYKQLEFEDLNSLDRTDMITAIIQFPANSVNKTGMKFKLAKTHIWLNDVLTKEFQNWTKDPFEESEEPINEKPFGNISIFYVMPTPETNASHITLTFIVYNAWKNETLPVHFVLGILNFYSKDLKESINASAAYFYHGLLTENYDLLSAMLEKYGIIIFTICLAVIGVTVLICVVIFYRRKTRQSVHYLADSKLQHNMQEAVGIDLTPASIILQDEKEEKGSKICDDEGWLVPITDVPLAEESNGPNVQDTKL
ncbi:uncharacterized protein TNCT_271531 [Trichonephila clavata]|uniref:Uncharacterized protein n=1 Tax=Trichonephila clavata TaxID=2740835 RepID=A0A8X6M3W5_TRICU|nr:uncharacterized protein TNCT_271531 [Trichonephila clavata]